MATKKEREIIFNKYDGRCGYCGDPLQKGWHVDELLPVKRKTKRVGTHYVDKLTREKVNLNIPFDFKVHVFVPSKLVSDGMEHPERLHIDNQMPSCPSCNINKHSGTLEEFRTLIQGFKKHLNDVSTQYKIAKRYGMIKEDFKPVVFYFEKTKLNCFKYNIF